MIVFAVIFSESYDSTLNISTVILSANAIVGISTGCVFSGMLATLKIWSLMLF